MAQRKRPTIRDVAAEAGVSISTVPKYVNGQQSFSRAVEDKLSAAIQELGYSQNPAARSMVTGRTTAIGLAIMDIANPHYANVVKGANRVALAHGYATLDGRGFLTRDRATDAPTATRAANAIRALLT